MLHPDLQVGGKMHGNDKKPSEVSEQGLLIESVGWSRQYDQGNLCTWFKRKTSYYPQEFRGIGGKRF